MTLITKIINFSKYASTKTSCVLPKSEGPCFDYALFDFHLADFRKSYCLISYNFS